MSFNAIETGMIDLRAGLSAIKLEDRLYTTVCSFLWIFKNVAFLHDLMLLKCSALSVYAAIFLAATCNVLVIPTQADVL